MKGFPRSLSATVECSEHWDSEQRTKLDEGVRVADYLNLNVAASISYHSLVGMPIHRNEAKTKSCARSIKRSTNAMCCSERNLNIYLEPWIIVTAIQCSFDSPTNAGWTFEETPSPGIESGSP